MTANNAANPKANPSHFESRHIGPSVQQQAEMAAELGYENLDALIDAAVPKKSANANPLICLMRSPSKPRWRN